MHLLHLPLDSRTPPKIHILNNFEFENMLLSPSQPDCLVLDFAHLTNSKFMRGLLKKTKYCSQISLLPSNSKHYNTVKERYKVEIDEKTMQSSPPPHTLCSLASTHTTVKSNATVHTLCSQL